MQFLSDDIILTAVFGSYTVAEALQVQHNITQALPKLPLPSADLLAHIEAEGLSLTDFDMPKPRSGLMLADPSVVKRHLKQLFLQPDRLQASLADVAVSEAQAVASAIGKAQTALRLPSAALLAKMAAEGLDVRRFGIAPMNDAVVPPDLVAQSQPLALPADTTASINMADTDMQQLRARLAAMLPTAPVTDEPATPSQLSSSASAVQRDADLALLRAKLKLMMLNSD
jgi:hypothetical protein